MTTHQDMLNHLGGVPVMGTNIPFGPRSKYYFVAPGDSNASDGNAGTNIKMPLATLAAAEDKCVANQHDTVIYIPGDTALYLSETLTWDKNYTHLLGLGARTGIENRARIFQTSTATGLSPLVNVTATGCVFDNFYIFQGVDDATSLINVQVTGGRNTFYDIHFAGGGHPTQAINGGASLKLNGAEANRFVNCTIGVDTVAAATGMAALVFDGSATRNIFDDCRLEILAGDANAILVELIDATAVDRYTEFNRCSFFANSVNKTTTIASAFVIPAGHTTTATIFINYPKSSLGFTDWDADDSGILYINTGTITGGGNAGFSVASNTT